MPMLLLTVITALCAGLLLHNIIVQYHTVHNFAASWKIVADLYADLQRVQQQLTPRLSTATFLTEDFLPDVVSNAACQEGNFRQRLILTSNKNSRYALWFCLTQRFNTCSGALSPPRVVAIVNL